MGTDIESGSPARYLALPATLTAARNLPPAADGAELRVYRTGRGQVLDRLTEPGQALPARTLRVVPAAGAPDGAVQTGTGVDAGLAAAIRIGPVMVKLDSHAAVDYGVAARLLHLDDEGTAGPVTSRLHAPDAFRVTCHTRPADDLEPSGGMQRVLYGWFLGMPLVHNVTVPDFYGGTAPAEPDPSLPAMRCYLTGTVDEQAPSSPVRQVPTADGMRTLTSHQNTTDLHPAGRPHNTFGFFVVRGPKGTDATVGVRPAPPDSLPPEPLAYRIRLGDRWVGLSNHLVIEYGVATGLLALVPLEYGGQMTTSFPGPTQLAVTCTPTGVVEVGEMARTTVGTLSIKQADMELVGHRPNSPVEPGARVVRVTCERLAFQPDEIRVHVGEPVAVELAAADVMHNLVIDEFGAYVQADAGQTATGGFRPDRAGTFEFYCSLMAHRAAGMTGRLVVEP